MELRSVTAKIKRTDDERRLVYAEVYAPNTLDTYGEFMDEEAVETLAHRFLSLDLSKVIDTNHDNIPNGSYPVESYVARENDPDFTPGTWVLVVKVPDDAIWSRIKSGDLNGYSFEAMVHMVDVEVEIQTMRDHVGMTNTIKGVDHEHVFFVTTDEKGRVIRGATSEAEDGHYHVINHGTMTGLANGHSHRFSV